MKLMHGTMHECSHPDKSLWFEPDEGETFPVKGDPDAVPTEVPMELSLEGDRVMAWRRDESVMAAPAEPTYENIALVYCNGGHVLDERLPVKEARRLQNNARRVTHGKKEINYTPYIVQDIEISTVTAGPWSELIADVQAQAPESAYYNGYLVLSPKIFSFCGNAYVGGSRACANPGTCPDATQNHEDGHRGVTSVNGKGLRHSGGPGGVYGDKAGSWMGSGGGRSNWLAAHLYHGGVITEDEVVHLEDGAVRAFLVDPEIQPVALRPGEHKAVFATGDRELCVSFHGRRVYVHRKEPVTAATWIQTWWLKTMHPGDTFTAEGVEVQFIAKEDGAAEVVVRTDESEPAPAPFPQWELPDDAYPVADSWGVWRNKQWTYQGIPVHINADGHVAVTWYTWDRDENPIWFVMQGDIHPSGDYVELTVWATNGQRNEWVDGHALMYFYTEKRGMLKIQSEIMGRTAMPLDRLTTKGHTHPLNGLYSTGNGEGFSVFASVNPDTEEERLFLWFYTYTEGTGHVSPAKQNWLHGDGADADTLTARQPKYGHPEVRTQYAELEDIGLTTIVERAENLLTITIDGDEYPVHRLI